MRASRSPLLKASGYSGIASSTRFADMFHLLSRPVSKTGMLDGTLVASPSPVTPYLLGSAPASCTRSGDGLGASPAGEEGGSLTQVVGVLPFVEFIEDGRQQRTHLTRPRTIVARQSVAQEARRCPEFERPRPLAARHRERAVELHLN